ncbi:MAG: endonuclease/exonuclease/phosphatase family protein [Guyparkeria sp.]
MTWNIHSCIDHRGRYTPERTARVLRLLAPDVVALQEANLVAEPADDRLLRALAPILPHWLFAPTHERGCLQRPGEVTGFGNLIMSRWPIHPEDPLELSHVGREPRQALRARLDLPEGELHCWAVHLGLGLAERREQGRRLAAALADLPDGEPLLLAGDFNEWLPRARSLGALHPYLTQLPTRRTFPAGRPLLPLDQIWMRGPLRAQALKAVRDPIVPRISDHLPLVADLTIEAR